MNDSKRRISSGFFERHKKSIYAFLIYFLISEMFIIGSAAVVIRNLASAEDMPNIEELERIPNEQPLSTVMYSADGVELRTFRQEVNRIWLEYRDIPQCMIDAILATEDNRFFHHWGVSLPDIARALVVNIKATRPTISKKFPYIVDFKIEQGGSTITQQLARTLFLNRRTSYRRKLKEAIVSAQIEHTYSKEEILEFFLNSQDFSNRYSGIQAAARGYFGKDAANIELHEAALLAGILQAPSRYNPRSTVLSREEQFRISKRRRDTVINMMVNAGRIPSWEAEEAKVKPIELADSGSSDWGKAPYFVEYVRRQLEETYGEKFVYTSGANVYTTLDSRLQEIAEKVLKDQLAIIQSQYADHIRYIRSPGLSNYQATLDSLDRKAVQGALIALDVKTGRILAMIGGREFSERNQFNRAVQSVRSAGSCFKPFVFTAALDNGWRSCDTIYDGYWSIDMPDGSVWEPRNFKGEHLGIMSLRDGFKLSQNMISVKLVNDRENRGIGPRLVRNYARKMGITTPIPAVPSIAIGTPEVRLIEMVSAYTTFTNLGFRVDPLAITAVRDKNDVLLFQKDEGTKTECLNPDLASLMITMMHSVTTEGTAYRIINALGMQDRPSAGKTGTGNEFKDTWFIGYTPHLICGVWIGFDSEESTLGIPYNTGATAPLPVWINFMKAASDTLGLPKDDFVLSNGLTTRRLCRDSYLLATEYCPQESIYTEFFIEGTEITETCNKHGPAAGTQRDQRFIPNRQRRDGNRF